MLNKAIVAASFAISAIATPVPSAACHDYVILSSRGTGELQGPSVGFLGMIKTTLATVPNGVEYDVVYPAAADVTQQSTFIGSRDIERYVNDGLKACPQQKYALLGYSQGATVTLEAFQNLTGSAADVIKAVVLIGNPYQVKNQAVTVDQFGGGLTRSNDGILLPLAGTLNLSPKLPENGKALNICYIGDPVCNGIAYTITSPAHLAYGASPGVQKLGSDFLISKLG